MKFEDYICMDKSTISTSSEHIKTRLRSKKDIYDNWVCLSRYIINLVNCTNAHILQAIKTGNKDLVSKFWDNCFSYLTLKSHKISLRFYAHPDKCKSIKQEVKDYKNYTKIRRFRK